MNIESRKGEVQVTIEKAPPEEYSEGVLLVTAYCTVCAIATEPIIVLQPSEAPAAVEKIFFDHVKLSVHNHDDIALNLVDYPGDQIYNLAL